MSVSAYERLKSEINVKLEKIETIINELREVKTEEEILKMEKAQELTERAFSYILGILSTDITENDQHRLIDSIKDLTNGVNIESVVDIEAVIRYFVVHNYVCNGDSYTGSMIHNYYLYEENGQMMKAVTTYSI